MKSLPVQQIGNKLVAFGALIWIVSGTVLSLRPEGNPPQTFRSTLDVMPFLGIGILLISTGFANGIGKAKGQVAIARRTLFFSASVYALGSFVRRLSLPGKWEPLMPLGFLGTIAGLLLCGIAFRRKNFASPVMSYCLIIAACTLLCFNDQYLPCMGIVFGIVMLIFSLLAGKTS
jgi:hypothetical protein